jgi:hypothetical protein
MTKFYCCSKCNEVGSYGVDEESGATTMDRGHFLACGMRLDAMTTGFATRETAQAWLDEHPYKPARPLDPRRL